MSDITDRLRAIEGSPDALAQQAAAHIDRAERENAGLKAALGSLGTTARMLYANAVHCIEQHHPDNLPNGELPGWLADCAADIEAVGNIAGAPPELVRCLETATGQWAMYADMLEDRDLKSEETPEGDMYRAILARLSQPASEDSHG